MLVEALRHLATWAPLIREAPVPSCEVLERLREVAQREGALAREAFETAVARSAKVLFPLGEPLTTISFIEHRWLGEGREEAYSDWLKWILAQAEAIEVMRILGVEDPEMATACASADIRIERESFVAEGHEGATGRLDLKIHLGDTATLVVEVKLGDAEHADTAKGAGYRRSVEADRYVLLVTEAADEDYCDFKPRRWVDVCLQLRLLAWRFLDVGRAFKAAMVLAFAATVEQNLLKFHADAARRSNELAAALILPPITDHLTRFVEVVNHAEEKQQ